MINGDITPEDWDNIRAYVAQNRAELLKELRSSVDAERRQNPWPQFGYVGGEPGRMATRMGFNMAIDIVLDKIDRIR